MESVVGSVIVSDTLSIGDLYCTLKMYKISAAYFCVATATDVAALDKDERVLKLIMDVTEETKLDPVKVVQIKKYHDFEYGGKRYKIGGVNAQFSADKYIGIQARPNEVVQVEKIYTVKLTDSGQLRCSLEPDNALWINCDTMVTPCGITSVK